MNDVNKILIEAVEDVEKANVPKDLREAAFREAVRLRERGKAAPDDGQQGGSGTPADGSSKPNALAKIADRFNADAAELSDVFAERNGEIELVISPSRLSKATAAATKEIALLIAGARQGAEIEEWTAVRVIRGWCEEFKKYDSANFAKTVASMGDVFSIRGQKQQREVKMARPAWERAGELVRTLVGGE